MLRKCVLGLCLLHISGFIQSQKPIVLEYRQLIGPMLDIHPFYPNTEINHVSEFSLLTQTTGTKSIHSSYNYPKLGVGLSYHYLGNSDTLGSAIGVRPKIAFQRRHNKFTTSLKLGAGLAWFNKPFDVNANPGNLVIGSRVTALVTAGAELRYNISKLTSIGASFEFWHYSNGHVRVPNIGANSLLAGLVFSHQIREHDVFPSIDSIPTKKAWSIGLNTGLGFHEIEGTVYPFDGPLYPVYFANIRVNQRISDKSKLHYGVNYNYYPSIDDYIVSQGLFVDEKGRLADKWVVYAGHEFLMGHLSFQFDLGFNVSFPFRDEMIKLNSFSDNFMHRNLSNLVGLNYYFKRVDKAYRLNPYISLALKTIGGKADYTCIRLGINI